MQKVLEDTVWEKTIAHRNECEAKSKLPKAAHLQGGLEPTITSSMHEVIPNPALLLSKFPEQSSKENLRAGAQLEWPA